MKFLSITVLLLGISSTSFCKKSASGWETYTDALAGQGAEFNHAAVMGHDGNVWATTTDFAVSKGEVKNLMNAFRNPSRVLRDGVIVVGGVTYDVREDDNTYIIGTKGEDAALVVGNTLKALFIGTYDAGTQYFGKDRLAAATNRIKQLVQYVIGMKS